MQRHEMIDAMRGLGLKGMAGAFDEAVTTGIQRNRTAMEILTDLLRAEAAHRHAASIRYRMGATKLPVIKDIDAFVFDGMPINEGLVRSLHAGSFLPGRRNVVLVGGTGTGKTHLAIAITASVVRAGARGRYFNTVDLVTRLEEESRIGKAGALAAQLARLDLIVLDELGYLLFGRPAAAPSCQQTLRADLGDHHHQPRVRRMAHRVRRPQDDHRTPRPHHPPLRHRRDRQRQLAVQEPELRPQATATTNSKTASRCLRLRSGYALPAAQASRLSPIPTSTRIIAKGVPIRRRSGVPFARRLTQEEGGMRRFREIAWLVAAVVLAVGLSAAYTYKLYFLSPPSMINEAHFSN